MSNIRCGKVTSDTNKYVHQLVVYQTHKSAFPFLERRLKFATPNLQINKADRIVMQFA